MKRYTPTILLFIVLGLFLLLGVLGLTSCKLTDYDLGPIHNHPPRIEVTNIYADGVLYLAWGYMATDTAGMKFFVPKGEHYNNEFKYGREDWFPVEPNTFELQFTPYDTVGNPVFQRIFTLRRKDKHNEFVIAKP